ncbi:cysteine hydrolase family protein [Paenibacillus donghaensis]|uniref:cysteine hydrolase family protein n=1 Tax=Paenibacillus donghaensis TaxID=414771 RepID=UPI0031835A4B
MVDMQNLFLQERMEKLQVPEACEYINHVAELLRAQDQVVIHIHDMEGSTEDTNPEARHTIPQITVGPQDLQVAKEYSNAFWKTDLEEQLRAQGVDFVIVAGFAAEHCVTFTANGAVERGFPVAILQKGILSTKPEAIISLYQDRHMISYPVVEYMVQSFRVNNKRIFPE